MSEVFGAKTFNYFQEATKHRKDMKWYEKNENLYREHVKEPFEILLKKCEIELSDTFPGINFDVKVSQPLFRKNKIPLDGTIIKPNSYVFLAEKATSMYEMNPGIYFSVGASETILGIGLYMPTSRQIKLLRAWITSHPEQAKAIFGARKLKNVWGDLAGDKFKRFPRDYDPSAPGAEYLWLKQFYVAQSLKRSEVTKKDFSKKFFLNIKTAAPFLNLLREIVGKYSPGDSSKI